MQPLPGIVSRPPPTSPAKAKPRASTITQLIGLIVGGLIGFLGLKYGQSLVPTLPGHKAVFLVDVLVLPFIWLLVVGVHELGHLIGGWITGGKFLLWIAGPFMVRRTPSGLVAGWNRSVNLGGGLAACLPHDPASVTPRRAAVMILGGPLASLVLATIASIAVIWLSRDPAASFTRALLQHTAVSTAGLSLLIFVSTLAPLQTGGFKSDGKRIIDLLRGDRRSAQETALMVITTTGLAGTRPTDLDPDLVARVIALRDGTLFDLYAHLTVYYHDADRADYISAQARLDYALTGEMQMVPYMRQILRCEYAWLLATQTADAAAARAWLESAGKLTFDPATRLRAEAAVLLAEGRKSEAAARIHEALHALEHKSFSPVKNRFAADALDDLLCKT